MKRFALFLCAVFFVALFVACSTDAGDEPEAPAPAATPAPATYTVTFDANAEEVEGEMEAQTFTRGVEQELRTNTFTRTGYAFAGWAKAANAEAKDWSNKESIFIEENITLYAVWLEGGANYTVLHYKQNTALNGYDEFEKETLAGTTGANTEAQAKEDYEGFTAKSFEQATIAADGSTVVNIYYDRNTYTVTFNANGGTGSMQGQTFTYGVAQALTVNAFTREGYTFADWATTANGTKAYDDKANYTIGAENVTLYAVWKPATYTVTFNANGGEGSMQAQTFTYGVAQALTANAFTRTGYTFAGWAITADGSKAYDDNVSYTIDAKNVTLYAVWKALSSDAKLKTLSFAAKTGTEPNVYASKGGSTITASPDVHEYYIEYQENLKIEAVPTNEKATVTLSNGSTDLVVTATDSTEKDVTLTVTAEDGVTKNTYTLHTVRVFTFDDAVTAIKNRTTDVTIKMVGTVQDSSLKCSYGTDSALSTALKSASSKKVSLDMSAVTELTSIEKYAFGGCTSLTSVAIPNSVTSIGDDAFYECTSLTSVTIPNKVTSIGYYAFYNCTSLTSVDIPNSVTSIEGYAFYECTSLTSVTIPNSVTSIGGSAFYECTSLKSVVIPNSVTSIEGYAFYECTSLKSVTIPDSVTSIGDSAFYECTSLTSVKIPDRVTSIENDAFRGCTSLKTVVIPDRVTSIGDDAFYECKSLKSVTIPASVTSIGGSAFYKCTSLTSVKIPASVTGIGKYAFAGCTSLTSVTIPDSVTSIGNAVFGGCTSLTSVAIPSSVTSIGDNAFRDCTSLTSVVIPASVTSIGKGAFYACTSLTSVTIPDSVTSIGDHAFSSCTSLKTVVIPDSVTSIETYAFSGCTSLTSVTIGNSVTSIGRSAFVDCKLLENAIFGIPSGWYYGNANYTGGEKLSETDLENHNTAAKYLRDTYGLSYWYRE